MDASLMESQVIVSGDEHVIHIYNEPALADFFFKNCVHHHLECGWGICQSEEHHCRFEEAFVGNKGCFPFISPSNANIVIPPSYIELSKERSSLGLVDELGNQWQWIGISDHPLIESSIVLHWS